MASETIADIERDLRQRAERAKSMTDRDTHTDGVGMLLDSIADRLKAARKREEPVGNTDKLGNAAATREALVALRDAARNFYHQILNSKYNDITDEYKCRERGFPALLDLRYAIPKANFALAAPARNCDTTESHEEIAKRFKSEVCEHYDNDWEDPRTQCTHNCVECVIKWMTAEKGGAE